MHITMSYQANFASHHTYDRHVGFIFARNGIGKYNKLSCYFLLSSCHNTKLQLRDKNITTHIRLNPDMKQITRNSVFCCFFSIPCHTKRKPRGGTESCAYRCVARCANTLFVKENFNWTITYLIQLFTFLHVQCQVDCDRENPKYFWNCRRNRICKQSKFDDLLCTFYDQIKINFS